MKVQNIDSLEFIQRLFVAAATRKLPDDIARIMMTGLAAYERGEFKTLDEAFGIRVQGMNSVCYKIKIRERDRILIKTADLTCSDLEGWDRAKQLSEIIGQFEARVLPRLRKSKDPKNNIQQWQALLFDCFELGVKIPSSPRQLFNIL